MMRRLSVWGSGVLVGLVLMVLLLVLWRPGIAIPAVWRVQQDYGSTTLLTEMRNLGQLETLVYVHRTVFPHDLIPPNAARPPRYRNDNQEYTPQELQSLQALSLAEQLGLLHPTNPRRDSFVVVTTQIHLGYDLEALLPVVTTHRQQNATGERVSALHLPEPIVLRVITEDIDPELYPFPPIPLDADGWRQVVMFTEQAVLHDPAMHQIRQRARAAGAEVLDTLMPGIFVKP